MSTIKSYTDLEQSKKLAEILPLESADRARCGSENVIVTNYISAKKEFSVCDEITITPCWSLSALLGILPVTTTLLKDGNISDTGDVKYSCECSMVSIHKWFDNPVDACVAMIEKLNELKML